MKRRLTGAWLAVALLAACASPEARIGDNPDAFARLPPEQQALVKQGQVGLGMSEAAVTLALGHPDRISERTDAQGVERVWHYTGYEAGPPMAYPAFYGPWFFPPYGPYYDIYPTQVERDHTRVVFRNGLVTAIERELDD